MGPYLPQLGVEFAPQGTVAPASRLAELGSVNGAPTPPVQSQMASLFAGPPPPMPPVSPPIGNMPVAPPPPRAPIPEGDDFANIAIPPDIGKAFEASRGAAQNKRDRERGILPPDPLDFTPRTPPPAVDVPAAPQTPQDRAAAMFAEGGGGAPSGPKANPLAGVQAAGRITPAQLSTAQKAYMQAQREVGDASARMLESDAAKSERLAQNARDEQLKLAIHDDVARTAEERRQERLVENKGKWNAAREKVANMTIDPNKGMSELSTGSKVAALIGTALFEFGNALTRTNQANPILNMLDDISQKAIDSQKAAMANAREDLRSIESGYAQMLKEFGDEKAAELAWRAGVREDFARRGEQIALDSNSERLKIAAQGIRKEVDAKNLKDEAAFLAHAESRALAAASAAARGAQEKPDPLYVAKAGGRAPDEKTADKLREKSAAVDRLNDLVDRAISLRENTNSFIPGTKENRQLRSVGSAIKLEVKNTENLGVLAGPDMGLISEYAGDATSVMPGTSDQLREMKSLVNRGLETTFKNSGIQKVDRSYVQDQSGRLHQRTELTGEDMAPRPPMPKSFREGSK